MRTTVDIDPGLLEKLRVEAARRGTSVKALLNSALRAGLAARVAEPAATYRLNTVSLGAPKMDLDRALRVADALEDEEHLRDLQRRK
jgi:plasmid stability protein